MLESRAIPDPWKLEAPFGIRCDPRAWGAATKIRTGRFRGEDGTQLAWYETGEPDGVPLVLCAGLGGGFAVWRPLLARLGRRFRVLTWDYRGLYASDAPRRAGALSMSHQVSDLVALLRHARVDAPVLVGWSMGVQLALELHREHPKLARGLIGLFGTAGRPFGTAFDAAWPAAVAPGVLAALRAAGTRFRGVGPALARAPGVARAFVGASRALGLMAPRLDLAAFTEVAEAWTSLDLEIYARHFEALDVHDAWDLLPDIETPSLLIAGGRDRLTPPHLAEQIAGAIPGADYALVSEATHFGLIEEPEAIAARILRFAHARLGFRRRTRPAYSCFVQLPRLEFFFDYGSPYSYVADALLPALCARTGAELVYRPMLLGGVFKATGNRSPAQEPIEAKRRYGGVTLRRYAEEAGLPPPTNPHFPIDTLALMRTAVAAQRAGVFPAFHRAMYPAFWARGLDLGARDVLAGVLRDAGLDADALLAAGAEPAVKAELRASTDEAVARGVFGAPTVFVGDQLFFGSDHLRFAERALREAHA